MKSHIIELIPQNNKTDYEIILPSFLSIWNHPDNLKFLSFTQQQFTQDMSDHLFKNHLTQGCRYFAALSDNKSIIGLLILKINLIETFEILGLGVLPELKKNGIGTSLIQNSIDLAENLKFKAIDVCVFCNNYEMLRLLLSFKFTPARFVYHAGADGMDILYLKKYL